MQPFPLLVLTCVYVHFQWNYTITTFDNTCWVSGFVVELRSNAYNTTINIEAPLYLSAGTFHASSNHPLPPNSELSPLYSVTVQITNNFDNTRKTSNVATFCIARPPVAPVISFPTSMLYITSVEGKVTFRWNLNDVGYPCGPTAVTYQLYVDETTPPTTLVAVCRVSFSFFCIFLP